MLGILYLLLAFGIGRLILPQKHLCADGKENSLWILLPGWFVTGTLILTWFTYGISYFCSVYARRENPLFYGNLAVMAGAFGILAFFYFRNRKTEGTRQPYWADHKRFKKEIVLFLAAGIFVSFFMFYVFFISDGVLYSGYTVFGDYAPHTAMMRSFSKGNNFPTQYPHFGGEDIKYHFMFQFLAGNLEYLGLRLDIAYNLISILSLLGFLMLLYALVLRIFQSFAVGALTLVLFFFRSSFSFFRFAYEHLMAGDLWQTLKENTSFIGYTLNEDWGLWNFNVYLNQRHLAFVLCAVCLVLFYFWSYLQEGVKDGTKGLTWLSHLFFTREAWKPKNLPMAAGWGVLLGGCSFWNGAAVIAGLLILAGFAVFSKRKTDYAVLAALTVLLSVIQTKLFMKGSSLGFSFYFGFLAEDRTPAGILSYLVWMSGIFFVGLMVLAVVLKRRERCLMAAFLLPFLFAFTVSMTPDINVNHKYIMISYAFLSCFWAWLCVRIWKEKKVWMGIVSGGLLGMLTITGIYDLAVIIKDNDSMHRVGVNMESETTRWLEENLDSRDLLLTPQYSINEVTMAGVMLYCGWPYYAWSAGYDTDYRAGKAMEIYQAADSRTLRELVEKENITYILYEENMEYLQAVCREDILEETYPLVYKSGDGWTRIYQVTEESE